MLLLLYSPGPLYRCIKNKNEQRKSAGYYPAEKWFVLPEPWLVDDLFDAVKAIEEKQRSNFHVQENAGHCIK